MLLINKPTNANRYEIYYNKRSKELSMALSGSTHNLNNTNIPRQFCAKMVQYFGTTLVKKLKESFFIDNDGLVSIYMNKRLVDEYIRSSSENYDFSQVSVQTMDNDDIEYYLIDIGYIPKVANFRESFVQYLKYIEENSDMTVYKTMFVNVPHNEWKTGKYIQIKCKLDTSLVEVKDITIIKPNYYKDLDNAYKKFSQKDLDKELKNASELFKINTLNYMLQKSLCE